MAENEETTQEAKWHRKQAVDCFNTVWKYLDRSDRTLAEDDTMLHMAHASRYHWEQVGTSVNLARGEWQVSRVYAVLNRAEPALYHASRCLEICQENAIGDFDLAYAYEAMARASIVAGREEERSLFLQKAHEAAADIAEEEDRALVLSDLATIPAKSRETRRQSHRRGA